MASACAEPSSTTTGTGPISSKPGTGLVVADTQSDSIQCLNFAKKWFFQYSIQYCFTQDSIQNIIQLKKICWFNQKDNSIQ